MTDEESKQRILQWQNRLHDAFNYNGLLGGKFLLGTIDLEKPGWGPFCPEVPWAPRLDRRIFGFLRRDHSQQAFHFQRGWPSNQPNYALIFVMYSTLFRTVRATEVLSVNGYPLQGYALQRSIKDQVFVLCAIANNMMGFNEMFGWEGLTPGETPTENSRKMAANRLKAERKIRSAIIGKGSGLSEVTQAELLHWEQLFNFETHRGLFTLFNTLEDAAKGKLDVVGPSPGETNEAMFVNRSNELNWMILRLLPCMRRKEIVWSEEWTKKWELLEESFRWMNQGFADLGKKIPLAHLEMIEVKFKFGLDHYYVEPK